MNMLLWLPFMAFVFVALLQIYYYLRYFRRLAFFRAPDKAYMAEQPVSVIICARDEADEIEKNLPGVLAQSYRSTHEIVVVNDNSQDDTKFLLEGLYRTYRQLHVVELKQEAMHIPGKKFPLSVGIKSAKHEILLMTDADCIPASEHWIRKMQEAYDAGVEIVLGYGAYKKSKGLLNKFVRFDAFHTALQYLSFALGGKPYMGVGRNLSYRRELFFRQKGFAAHHHLPGGDDDLFVNSCANRLNTRVVIDQDAFTYSTPPRSWSSWLAQKERHNSTGKFYKSSHRWMLGWYMISQCLFYPLFIAALFFFDWRIVVGVFLIKSFVQALVYYRSMKKLGEGDLFIFFPLWDLWMMFYYIMFVSTLWKTPKAQWS
ncbi:MAG: glycosyltransferase [Chitinophagaceae bacterium]|jgi:glycosyltransferase involved in cell wall biosynthesis